MRFAFAGDRQLAVDALGLILDAGQRPEALLLSSRKKASHGDELRALCDFLPDERVLRGRRFKQAAGIALLRELDLDLVLGVHFPYIVPPEVLALPRAGVLNLHPAYLPYNRGWHTPSWAILDGTPYGATLHLMDEGVDTGPIVHQRQLDVSPGDTADTLYARVLALELEVLREAWPRLVALELDPRAQDPDAGTAHKPADLLDDAVRRVDADATCTAGDLLRRLRALSTNRVDEAAYAVVAGERRFLRVRLAPSEAAPTLTADAEGPAGELLERMAAAGCVYEEGGRRYALALESGPLPEDVER